MASVNVTFRQILRSPRRFVPRVFSTARFRIVVTILVIAGLVFLFNPQSQDPNRSVGQLYTTTKSQLGRLTSHANPMAQASSLEAQALAAKAALSSSSPLAINQQNFHHYNDERKKWWSKLDTGTPSSDNLRSAVVIISWNVDYMGDEPEKRMEHMISYLRSVLVTSTEESDTLAPAVLLLQEVSALMMNTLTSDKWIRKNFYISDIGNEGWTNPAYGTITLVDIRLHVSAMFRVKFAETRFGRDVLFTDLHTNTVEAGDGEKILRIGNTHLESLFTNLRPGQIAVAAQYMKAEGVHGSILAGDFNPIQEYDAGLPAANDLKDAYLEAGFSDDGDSGHTWGYQTEGNTWPPKRFDKMLYYGDIRVEQPKVIAKGKKTLSGRLWLSDHYALTGTVRTH